MSRTARTPAWTRTQALVRTVAVLLVALLGLVAVQGCGDGSDTPGDPAGTGADGAAELRDGAVRVAERAALALASLDHRDPEAGFDALLALLTDPARQQWEQRRAEYLGTLTSDAATTEGATVDSSAVSAFDQPAATAEVLVAASARISSAQSDPGERRYRLRMSLVRDGAEWKVSELEEVVPRAS